MTDSEFQQEGAQPAAKPVYYDPALQALYQMVLVLGEEFTATKQLHALIGGAKTAWFPQRSH